MKMEDLSNLSVDNIGGWPIPIKAAVVVLVCVIIGIGGWQLDTMEQLTVLDTAEKKELTLRADLESKQRQASRLSDLKNQLVVIKETFGDLLRRLPNKTEVAGLLVDISQQGLGAGLEFELFKPGVENKADFYVELPISITVTGSYHQFGRFVSGISDLPRIVTTHEIKITKKDPKAGRLTMQATAKTYRYMDEDEEAVNK
jgi:type IV pilus assembly protein PilO